MSKKGKKLHRKQAYLLEGDEYLKTKKVYKGYKNVRFEDMTFDFSFLDDDYTGWRKRLIGYSMATFKYFDEEVIQTAILRACRYSYKYDPTKSNKMTWMSKILYNEMIRHKREMSKKIYLDDDSDDKDYHNIFGAVSLDDGDIEESLTDYVDLLVSIISNGKFEMLKKRAIDKMTYEEISINTGLALGTVKTRMFNERKRLKKLLEDHKQGATLLI